MTSDDARACCATDAVRCLYLARVAERLGHPTAARRWYQKADRWLETIRPRRHESSVETKNRSGTARPNTKNHNLAMENQRSC